MALILSIIILQGCVEEETGNIKIPGKGYFDSIQQAIDAASNNDKILVNQGIYNESLMINTSINLIAVNKDSTIIQYIWNEKGISLIEINADNCTIDGFVIVTKNTTSNSNAIKVKANTVRISNNTIQDFYQAIYVLHMSNHFER